MIAERPLTYATIRCQYCGEGRSFPYYVPQRVEIREGWKHSQNLWTCPNCPPVEPEPIDVIKRGDVFVVKLPTPGTDKEPLKEIVGYRWSQAAQTMSFPASPLVAADLAEALPLSPIGQQTLAPYIEVRGRQIQARKALQSEPPPLEDTDGVPFTTPLPPWRHQRQAYWFARDLPAVALNMGLGTGKSRVVIDLIRGRKQKRVLIVCPKAVIPTWQEQFKTHGTRTYSVVALTKGTAARKLEMAQRSREIVVVNYESVWRGAFGSWVFEQDWDLVVADEGHRLKDPSGVASKFMAKLGRRVPCRLVLSGTLLPHSPLDAYGVFRFLDPGIFGTSYVQFRSHYAELGTQFQGQVLAYKNTTDLQTRLGTITFKADTADVLDLPDGQHLTRKVDLPPKVRKIYDSLKRNFVAWLSNGEEVTAPNALVRVLRLQQVTSGFLGEEETLHAEKRIALENILEELHPREPVVVFCRFSRDLQAVHAAAANMKRESLELSGQRNELEEWQDVHAPPILAVQQQSGSEGVTLVRARYCVYFSLSHSLGQYEQSLGRVRRPGQKRSVVYLHIVARGTIDEMIYRALSERKEVIDTIMKELKCPTC